MAYVLNDNHPLFKSVQARIFHYVFVTICCCPYSLQVDKIYGPGNQYVTAAKMILQVFMLFIYENLNKTTSFYALLHVAKFLLYLKRTVRL